MRTPRKPKAQLKGVEQVEPNLYVVTSEPPPRTGLSRLFRDAGRLLLGAPIPSSRETHERIGLFSALAVLGADMIASSVYGPEEMMRMLGLAGTGALAMALPLAIAIAALLAILAISYQQTIEAYPNGAGGYVVASDNLGATFGLIGGAALLIDYMLDVSVSISSGVESTTSALPSLAAARVPIALAILLLLTLANLRGIRTSGALFAFPVYAYIFATLATVGYGMMLWASGTLPRYTPPPAAQQLAARPAEALGLLLILRAFSSGAVALTGIEATSNGVPYMKPPETRNARISLVMTAGVFAILFLGISFLASRLQMLPDPTEVETLLSQLTRTLWGSGPIYVASQGMAVLMLILAANTGFADLPRVLSQLANDGYVPKEFGERNARLSLGNGILLAAIVSGVLIVVFRGSVSALVPLFTVGAILTFTLSQAGMARHWWRRRGAGWQHRLAVNAVGAMATGVVLVVVVVSKFAYGAWIVVLLLPVLVFALRGIGQYTQWVREHVRVDDAQARGWTEREAGLLRHHIVIPISGIDRVALHAVAYALSLERAWDAPSETGDEARPIVEVVHVTDDQTAGEKLKARWDAIHPGVPLVILESPYRARVGAFLRYLDLVERQRRPGTLVITVLLPEAAPPRFWQGLLHNPMAFFLKTALFFRRGTVVTSVPYHVPER